LCLDITITVKIKILTMATQIFINLPIKDLKKSMAFYEAIGFKNNPQFTDETAAAMAFSENVVVMLLTYNKFKEFTSKSIIDAKQTAGVLNSLSFQSNAEMNEVMCSIEILPGILFNELDQDIYPMQPAV
jgi:uncharacterized protein